MKRFFTAGLCAGFLFGAASAIASAPTQKHLSEYRHLYSQVAKKFGKRTPGRNIAKWGLASGKKASDADIVKSLAVLERFLAPPAPPQPVSAISPATTTTTPTAPSMSYTAAPTASYGGGYANVPGVPASFAACVAMRESSNGAGSSNIYGILGPGGQGTLAQQKQAFSQMYASRGTQPWAPYDGC